MRAIQFDSFGPPSVLVQRDHRRPVPAAGEVLVRVHASSVNQHDVFVRSGRMRIATGSRFPFGTGVDFAGEVVAHPPGDEISYRAGTRVWGTLPGIAHRFSAGMAEYVAVPLHRIAPLPPRLSATDGVALVAGGTAALTALRDIAHVRPGERVLVRGGAGAVGSMAVQYAHAVGAHVTTLVSARHLAFAEQLGADEVYDRSTAAALLPRFDVIVDTVGQNMRAFRSRLSPQGRMVSAAFNSLAALGYVAVSSIHGSRRVRAFLGAPDSRLLSDLADLATDGSLVPVVDTVYAPEEIQEAHRALEARGSQGKHVIRLI